MPVRANHSLSAPGVTPWVPFNQDQSPFNVSFGVVLGSDVEAEGTSYTIEHTFANVKGGAIPSAEETFPHQEVKEKYSNADGNYAFPIGAARLKVIGIAGSGSISATFLQSGE